MFVVAYHLRQRPRISRRLALQPAVLTTTDRPTGTAGDDWRPRRQSGPPAVVPERARLTSSAGHGPGVVVSSPAGVAPPERGCDHDCVLSSQLVHERYADVARYNLATAAE